MASGHSRRFDIGQAESSQRMEDNVETSLQLRHPDSNDSAWVRLPLQYIRWLWLSLSHVFLTWIWPVLRGMWSHRVHVVFILLLLVFGVLLSISTSRGVFSPGLLIIESYIVIIWVIYSTIVRQNRGHA
ncbi:hypothetical protein EV127DRAFT_250058 [Xylaria flabelliformis]|nr:hypothetical protein EV127DRAFT_250058 [Xylaria flabelliformis]